MYHDERDGRYDGRGLVSLPLPPKLALCLSCHWLASGDDARERAAAHRDETSHVTLASLD